MRLSVVHTYLTVNDNTECLKQIKYNLVNIHSILNITLSFEVLTIIYQLSKL